MPTTVILAKSAAKFLKKLRDQSLCHRLSQEIARLETTPFPHGFRKIEGRANLYRLRVGDYRIIYEIEKDLIIVSIIEHRNKVYELVKRLM